jgi:hypothetical protein
MLDQHQDAERSGHEGGPGTPLYRRPMPGGGYVQVELDAPSADVAPDDRSAALRGRVVIERRADPGRRYGHRAPVVAELAGDDRDALMADLFQLARDNAALARSLLQRRTAPERAD